MLAQLQSAFRRLEPVVHYANRLVCGPGESFGPRVIGDYQWIYVKSGKGKARIGPESFRATAGCLFAYGPDEPHWFESSEDDPLDVFGLHFGYEGGTDPDDPEARLTIRSVGWERFEDDRRYGAVAWPRRMETGTWPLPLFERIVAEYRGRQPMSGAMLRGMLLQLLVRTARWADEQSAAASPHDRRIAEVKERLAQRAAEPYDPGWLPAWMSPYSHDYVSRLFRDKYGTSPHDYHAQMRLAAAEMLLEETEMTSTAIAEALGFGSIHYFCKWFKLRTGIRPLEHRQRRRFL